LDNIGKSFKISTIEKTIKYKINKWINHFTDNEELRLELKNDIIVTGGAIPSMLLGDLPNDYDIYFQTKSVAKKVANHYLEKATKSEFVSKIEVRESEDGVEVMIKSSGFVDGEGSTDTYRYFEQLPPSELEEFFENYNKKVYKEYEAVSITSNSIYLQGDINLILRFCGNPEEIHKNFDFIHTKNYFTYETGVVLDPATVVATITKELIYVGSKFPICSLFRLRKFIARGFTITAGQIFKISWDISKLDLNDRDVIRAQLIGVDQAYMSEIINILNENSGRDIDRTYLFELVDRVFSND